MKYLKAYATFIDQRKDIDNRVLRDIKALYYSGE